MTTVKKLEVKGQSLKHRIAKLAESEGQWITVRGRHIQILDGESVQQAISRGKDWDKSLKDRAALKAARAESAKAGQPVLRGKKTWGQVVAGTKVEVARYRKKKMNDKEIANLLYDTHQNVPKRLFDQFLKAVGVKATVKDDL